MTALNGNSAAYPWETGPKDFGGHAYGLEPLALPPTPPRGSEEAAGGAAWAEPDGRQRLIESALEPPGGPPAPETADQLFWFRWITGHQITFILWQELGRLLPRTSAGPEPRADAPNRAARLVRAYSAMLLYTGSCTREVYHRVIRPSMALQHPGFSGAWASDYGPVRSLLRGQAPAAWDGAADAVLRECALNATVHEGVADKLVPGEPSLFESSAGHGRPLHRDMLSILFDTYFLTLRVPLPHSAVLVQLLRRVHAVRDDLVSNGLYPSSASSRDEKPTALTTVEIEETEEEMAHLVVGVARDAVRHVAEPTSP